LAIIFTVLKILFASFLGMAAIAFVVDGLTGWGEKGQHKKTVYVTLVLCIVSFGVIYILAKVF